jgi:hypothetical protein
VRRHSVKSGLQVDQETILAALQGTRRLKVIDASVGCRAAALTAAHSVATSAT